MSEELRKRLEIKAGMITMGEKISWGSDAEIMLEAAAALTAQAAEIAALREALKPFVPSERVLEAYNELGFRISQKVEIECTVEEHRRAAAAYEVKP